MADAIKGAIVTTKREGTGIQPQVYNGILSLVSMYKGKQEEEYKINWVHTSFKGKISDKSLPMKVELGPVDGEYALDRLKTLWKECKVLIDKYEAQQAGNAEEGEEPPF
jgi:hypothetical protein